MPSILDNLTEAQRRAVTHLDGPMLVIAGAGSGKTRVVTRRIAHLISKGVWPNQILAMTFTNKAAREMKERVAELTGSEPRWVGTFHSACAKFLRRDMSRLDDGRTTDFTIYDTNDQNALLKLCLRELGIRDPQAKPAIFRALISRAKANALEPDDCVTGETDFPAEALAVYRRYETRMRELNAVDFDDLLLLTVRLLRKYPNVRDLYHSRFRYILVDEYQDTNRLQYLLMRLLAGKNENVHATGDPDQSIYSWRGAEYRNILDFTTDFPNAEVVRLEQNYRSTKQILHAANQLIHANCQRLEKDLFTENEEGAPVAILTADSERNEATEIIGRVRELRLEGYRLQNMAVFYRTNAQSRSFEEALTRNGIRYQVIGGLRFYERREVKDILAHLRILVNPRDIVSLQRVADCRPTGVGETTLRHLNTDASRLGLPPVDLLTRPDFTATFSGRKTRKLKAFAEWCRELVAIPTQPVGEAVFQTVKHAGLIEHFKNSVGKDPRAADRLENLDALVDHAYEFQKLHPEADVNAFLEVVTLLSDVDEHDADADRFTLMTLHASKGLEFDVVFIVGAEEGYLPLRNAMDDANKIEEERRLFYVGITRGKKQVFVSHARSRYLWGSLEPRKPSRFLDEFPADVARLDNLYTW